MNRGIFSILIVSILSISSILAANLKSEVQQSHYAVLVAGSNSFWNYRHQADIFHAYHILIQNGMSPDNIIVMAYDDVANDFQNPFQGKVFNKPDPNGEGQDYYQGVKIDYRGDDVTPEVFLDVIQGNRDNVRGIGTGRVLESTENDNVFINFSDHGATGLVAFPNGELYADDLIRAFNQMNQNRKYNKLVFYLEACESGSMFNQILPENIKIYATSAANPSESSWATYCTPNDKINGQSVGSCLGDEYSVTWMEDSDKNTRNESLKDQFTIVHSKVEGSEPMEWGEKDFTSDRIDEFQGVDSQSSFNKSINNFFGFTKEILENMLNLDLEKPKENDDMYEKYLSYAKTSSLDSRDVKLHYLYNRFLITEDKSPIVEEMAHRDLVDNIFMKFTLELGLEVTTDKNDNINFPCLKEAVNHYKLRFNGLSEYSLKFVKNLHVACKSFSAEEVKQTLDKIAFQ